MPQLLHAQSFSYEQANTHPRLFLKAGEEQHIRQSVSENREMKVLYDHILHESDSYLTTPTLLYQKEGKRLLAVSREALKRIFYLSFAYRMTGDEKYALRAEQEMVNVTSFKDWNPSHFLDTGEMTLAVAIGYDWLYEKLSPQTREAIQKAIQEKGFEPSYKKPDNWFLTSTNNWNQVCNAGLACGAMAILNDVPAKDPENIIERAVSTITRSMGGYAPDGCYPEGYNYWGYGTTFNVFLIAALESCFGTDNGLSQTPGLMESARYMQYMTGTAHTNFNFSDAGEKDQLQPALFWFAAKTGDASLAWNEKQFLGEANPRFSPEEDRFVPLGLIYGSKIDFGKIVPPARKLWAGQGVTPVALIRTGWEQGKGMYVGIKGGKANTSHAHMDGGSFVFEALGVRWAKDLGMQGYYSLEKEGINLWDYRPNGERWSIFRYNNFAHNTLTVNHKLHNPSAAVRLIRTFEKSGKIGAQLDLAPLFNGDLKRADREIALVQEKYLEVTDNLQAGDSAATVCWTMVTAAQPKQLDNRTLELTQDGKTLKLTVDRPSAATIAIVDNKPPHSYDAPNRGTRRVQITVNLRKNEKKTLKIKLIPIG